MAAALPRRLADGPIDALAPKARRLAQAAAAGLDVPEGWVVDASVEDEVLRALLSKGPIALRSCGAHEDDARHSGAGLGVSILGVTTLAQARAAIERVGTAQVIAQRQIQGRWLLVAAVTEHGPEIEVHAADGEGDALSGARSPHFSGRLAGWTDPAAARVAAALSAAVAAMPHASRHGWDLELVVDHSTAWVVQIRPLSSPLHPGWRAFVRAVAASQRRATPRFGPHALVLDAEHNPAPLSHAHAWVIARLARERGAAAGHPQVLAGWLYVATLPRDLAVDVAGPSARAALQLLVDDLLPAARHRLLATCAQLHEPPTAASLAPVLEHAWSAFVAMIDAYVRQLVPARHGPRKDATPGDPLSLRERARYLDVLPATWDVASPTLRELGVTLPLPEPGPIALPVDEPTARTLLAEWDDHLFALGMAPIRAVFLWVAGATGLADDVFLLSGDELAAALEGEVPDLEARRELARIHASLNPPLRIEDGHPSCQGSRARLRGIPIGPSFDGIATHRRDLQALLDAPPGPHAVVMTPALTAPAAVALQAAGVRAVCSEHGGALSHAALMARELGLSALIGCRGCTEVPEGTPVRVDTRAGRLLLRS